VGVSREIRANNAGIIVQPNPESLYKGMKTLLDDENLRKIISENGKKMVKEYYDIDKVADQTIRMYKEVLNK